MRRALPLVIFSLVLAVGSLGSPASATPSPPPPVP
jgi:hypothetical protein